MSAGDFRLLLHLLVEVRLPLLFQIVSIFYAQCGGLTNSDARVVNALLPILDVLVTLCSCIEQITQVVWAKVM